MGDNLRDRWSIPVTAVANEFIDRYMASANGEYVKVYLYVLRHSTGQISVEQIADFLGGTESDVRRALTYWKKLGVLLAEAEPKGTEETGNALNRMTDSKMTKKLPAEPAIQEKKPESPVYSAEQVNRLGADEEFSQLLYIAQKYLGRAFTPRDSQVFAYLYDSLGMKSELLEYLVEYCVQNGHTSLRYLETVAINWHEKGIVTAAQARDFGVAYTKDAFAVMKAFGLSDRKPAPAEQKLMERWFKEYGFSREVVLEACNRTITAIHNPSFQYADKILSDWQEAGVKNLEDVKKLDAGREMRRQTMSEEDSQARERRLKRYAASGQQAEGGARKGAPNQFHNFKQRDTDYDALVLRQVKEWVGQQP